ncbi:MAG: TonB-dependent receptor [Cyclobacteriaceae bacterium]|nr:TonB-dependent receptor [Cyclobacteriaceae bacterium]
MPFRIFVYAKFITLGIFSLSLSSVVSAQQDKTTLNGYVRDAATGEELIGVTIYLPEIQKGVTTNVYGFYSITVPAGKYIVSFSYVGYTKVEQDIDLTANTELNFDLKSAIETMDEVVITAEAEDANVTDLEISTEKIDLVALKNMPSVFGEPDLIKMVQMMPGVITAGEGTSSYFVRGGSADQNLILIDEAPIYDPSHLFGYISVFNSDVIKDSKLYKGGIPAQYGGRLSSILDVRTKDGNNKKYGGSASIGTLASKATIEGPIIKDKASFILSARRSYADLFLKMSGNSNSVYFYDVNAKVNWKPSNKDRFYAAAYFGRDAFNIDGVFGFDWGNATGTFRWNHLFSEKLFSNTTFIASQFDYGLELSDPALGFKWTSVINELSFKQHFNWFISPKNELDFGYNFVYRRFEPANFNPTSESSIFTSTELQKLYALDHSLYVGNKQTVSSKLSLIYGLRLSIFQNVGPGDVKIYDDPQNNIRPTVIRVDTYDNFESIINYINLEPRFSARYLINDLSSVKASYNRMVQNVHLISSGTVPLPFNTWNPSSTYLKPQIADQVAVGYFRNFKDNMYSLSSEVFYKKMQNVTDFADNADVFFNEDLATEFRQGDSEAYGLELQFKKTRGRFTGFVNYTWSKSTRLIPGVNLGNPFPSNFDRRNAFNILASYLLSERWNFSSTFTYSTGRPITLPTGQYEYQFYRPSYISERNGYLLPAYHRLDFSAVLTPLKNKNRHIQTKWVFAIYNAYNRQNPFTLHARDIEVDDVSTGQKEFVMIYLFPIVPSVTFNLSF